MYSLLGLLTRSCKSTRRHALEIMNNLVYLRDACFELTSINMPIDICALSSSWLGTQCLRSTSAIDSVRVLHPLKLQDPFLSSIFRSKIVFYSTAFIGQVRLTTADYSTGKTTDDSNIVLNTGSRSNFGRIKRIFKVNNAEPLFYIHTISNLTQFQCAASSNTYQYSDICTGSPNDGDSYIFISITGIVEKCVFYQNTEGNYTFYRFPNLQESS